MGGRERRKTCTPCSTYVHVLYMYMYMCICLGYHWLTYGSLSEGDCVLEGAIVEGVGRELGQGRVHPVLDHQPNGLHSQQDQPLEEALRETSTGGREGGRQ